MKEIILCNKNYICPSLCPSLHAYDSQINDRNVTNQPTTRIQMADSLTRRTCYSVHQLKFNVSPLNFDNHDSLMNEDTTNIVHYLFKLLII